MLHNIIAARLMKEQIGLRLENVLRKVFWKHTIWIHSRIVRALFCDPAGLAQHNEPGTFFRQFVLFANYLHIVMFWPSGFQASGPGEHHKYICAFILQVSGLDGRIDSLGAWELEGLSPFSLFRACTLEGGWGWRF